MISDILYLLGQMWGPTKITYRTKNVNLISPKIISFHLNKLKAIKAKNWNLFENYNLAELFSLYYCVHFVVCDLWENEYSIITGKDFKHWINLLEELKKFLIK